MDIATLQAAIDEPDDTTRALLFSLLAHSQATVREKAAEGLLKLYAKQRCRDGLAHDFGSEPEAILTRLLDEIRASIDEPRTDPWTRFLASMVVDYDSWRDGTGYDMAALNDMSAIERGALRELIRTRLSNRSRSPDWRDLEVSKALDETAATKSRTADADPHVRLRATELLGSDAELEQTLCRTLRGAHADDAVARALDQVEDHATPDVRDALIARVQKIDAHFIPAAMVLLEVFGKVEDAWAERPFLFKVQQQGASGELMKELLARTTLGT
jgi:hypothetical protein